MKKKLLFQSDFALAKTGFGRVAKALMEYLYRTGKYDIVHFCVGVGAAHPELLRTPWKSVGCLPNTKAELDALNKDPHTAKLAGYGALGLDDIIYKEKPDVYIAAQDIWGVDFAIERKWFKKITSVIWTTLDSLPILPSAINAAKKLDNYWIWSDFATKDLNKQGFNKVKTVHGPLDPTPFFRMKDEERAKNREANGIPLDSFIVGFVFRNQLRKSVPNLLEGFSLFCKENPDVKNPKLLLHTHFNEGWDIMRMATEYNISADKILATYICKACNKYQVKPFQGHEIDCPICKTEKGQVTTHPAFGVSESQLNEIYNLMDVYCHPFTSGGQEIPIQEAKFTELITLVTNYSCGEDMCVPEANSLALDWAEYREQQTQFIKASTRPFSISKQLTKVWKMDLPTRTKLGKIARQWAIENYSINVIGKAFEEFLDNAPKTKFDFVNEEVKPDPNFQLAPTYKNESEWILAMYNGILKYEGIDENDDGFKYWMSELKKGMKPTDIEMYFRQTAAKTLNKINVQNTKFDDLLDKDDEGKRLLVVMPKSAGDVFWITSLLPDIKRLYPELNIYVSTQPEFRDVLAGNELVHKWVPYSPQMDNLLFLEGYGDHKGYFEIAFMPHIGTQKVLNYLHNGKDRISFNIRDEKTFSNLGR